MAGALRSLVDGALGLLFPDRCIGCGQTGTLFCPACLSNVRPSPHHGRITDLKDSIPLDEAAAAYVFEGALREAVHELKYNRVQRMAVPLGDLLATYIRAYPLPADALIPIPLHPKRLAERGFNQSALMGQRLSHVSGIPLLTTGLVRNRDTAHQVGLDAQARQHNLQGAFVWQHTRKPPARIVLLDDVLTTGATMGECAQALRAAGAREVRALALARSRSTKD